MASGSATPPSAAPAPAAAPSSALILYGPGADDDDDDYYDTSPLGQVNIFALKKPKNVISGTGDCMRNVLTGVAMGVGALVVAPVVGAKEEGVKGFFTGVAKGAGAPLRAGRSAQGARVRGSQNPPTVPSPSPAPQRVCAAQGRRRVSCCPWLAWSQACFSWARE